MLMESQAAMYYPSSQYYYYNATAPPPHKSPYELKCKYAFKNCTNVRSQKRTGGLHTLCEFHRQKANEIQKAYAQKKRLNPKPPSPSQTTGVEPIPFSERTNDDATLAFEDCLDLIRLLR
ncbi:hypothetical protein SPRG_10342 [Saprolegnia parasitica CBS 223.65]|uniref:Uncharacterized protein n=1 Tax=Saprolegnia parasitica (strain CBS 223.65) TaxID=695850 RepID=A0A067CCH6_SAPPC|nr:hypothetical protein SPRG_10342 [Saprolegnia parasitica CBS 223.65]KDO24527.1 hypothetical protein SPRG_10342 [Saprolegnia parasitica CBS 223.65]|eukprot:XP_012204789.1 hypothetical protein SPRG_10342 [Saprolegnia parasitica CBS 223.65]